VPKDAFPASTVDFQVFLILIFYFFIRPNKPVVYMLQDVLAKN